MRISTTDASATNPLHVNFLKGHFGAHIMQVKLFTWKKVVMSAGQLSPAYTLEFVIVTWLIASNNVAHLPYILIWVPLCFLHFCPRTAADIILADMAAAVWWHACTWLWFCSAYTLSGAYVIVFLQWYLPHTPERRNMAWWAYWVSWLISDPLLLLCFCSALLPCSFLFIITLSNFTCVLYIYLYHNFSLL